MTEKQLKKIEKDEKKLREFVLGQIKKVGIRKAGEVMGIDESSAFRYISGSREINSIKTLLKYARAFINYK